MDRYVGSQRTGAIALIQEKTYRVPEPLYSIFEEISGFENLAAAGEADIMKCLATVQSLVGSENARKLLLEGAVRNLQIKHAKSFSLAIEREKDEIDFNPVLFNKRVESNSGAPENLLDGEGQPEFWKRFRQMRGIKNTYPLGKGKYVYIDEPLRKYLAVVKQKQGADFKAKADFVSNPRVFFDEILKSKDDGELTETIFIETGQYSERVIGIGIWQPPVLPWIKASEETDWLPEQFGIKIGNEYIPIDKEDIETLIEQIREAIENGEESVTYNGHKIPATGTSIRALEGITIIIEPDVGSQQKPDALHAKSQMVLIVNENYEIIKYRPSLHKRKHLDADCGELLTKQLYPHQKKGIKWLCECYASGFPGALLADDMGLGKTLQALAFLALLRKAELAAKPFLVVAPKTLLENWKRENREQLVRPSGELVVFGRELDKLKMGIRKIGNREVPRIDVNKIKDAKLVLTTYETIRNYQLDFGQVFFSCVIYDEMQKVKNPASQVSNAAKSINAEFSIGLTGTPVENSLTDLWAIMDILYPGFLGELKVFAKKYDQNNLDDLKAKIMNPQKSGPQVVLRRLKDLIKGLPKKTIKEYNKHMPSEQARTYHAVVSGYRKEVGAKLKLIHKLRGISLHPYLQLGEEDVEQYKSKSARLVVLFEILQAIKDANEKVLIFIESLDMQDTLSTMIREVYSMDKKPLQINGTVSSPARQRYVDKFQGSPFGFDVILLSPRAAGIGLTLTAANHVIHLSRWWNPAVEDQCTDRVYRIGQEKDVTVHYPFAIHPSYPENCFDAILKRMMDRKRAMAKKLLLHVEDAKDDLSKFFDEHLGEFE